MAKIPESRTLPLAAKLPLALAAAMAAAAGAARALGGEHDPAKVVERLAAWMRARFETEAVGVFLVSTDGKELVASEGRAPVPTIAVDDPRSSAAHAFRERRPTPVATDDAARG